MSVSFISKSGKRKRNNKNKSKGYNKENTEVNEIADSSVPEYVFLCMAKSEREREKAKLVYKGT